MGVEEGLMQEGRAVGTTGVQELREDCGSEDWGGLPRMEQEQQKGVCGSEEKIEAEYQEGRARGKVQGKIDKELEGQAWIKERRDRGHL